MEKERIETELKVLIDFYGVSVVKREGNALQELERLLKKAFNANSRSPPGFQIENQHVLHLHLYGLGLTSLPAVTRCCLIECKT